MSLDIDDEDDVSVSQVICTDIRTNRSLTAALNTPPSSLVCIINKSSLCLAQLSLNPLRPWSTPMRCRQQSPRLELFALCSTDNYRLTISTSTGPDM
jgi:hypothetical protein